MGRGEGKEKMENTRKKEKIKKKRPEREQTQEADWIADLTCNQLKKDATGCLEEATEELKQSPEDKISVGIFFLGVISSIARLSRRAAFQAVSV